MATLAAVARERKNALRSLLESSRKLDAKQEILEREVIRLKNRKRAIPEVSDMARLVTMADGVAEALRNLVAAIAAASDSFRMG